MNPVALRDRIACDAVVQPPLVVVVVAQPHVAALASHQLYDLTGCRARGIEAAPAHVVRL